jgi:hypothetical protein
MNPRLKNTLKRLAPRRLLLDRHRSFFLKRLETDLFMSLPGEIKRTFVRNAAGVLQYPIFVETGTYTGEMARFASGHFRQVHSIELDASLADAARKYCSDRANVTIHQGDSGALLGEILPTVREPAIMWLDAHYSGGKTARGECDTPVLQELQAISNYPLRPVAVFIDDARVFGMDDAYPSLESVIALLRGIDPAFLIGVSSDVLWASRVKLLDFKWQTLDSGLIIQPSTMDE